MAAGNNAANLRTNAPISTTVTPKSDTTISVGCKLPHGIHLDFRQKGEPTQRFTLKGTNSLNPEGVPFPISRIGGYAITHGVPKEFFEKWMTDNRFHPAVKNHLIFAHKDPASVQSMGKEFAEIQSGLDPLDPSKKVVGGVTPRNDQD